MSRRGLLLFAAMCVIWGIPYLLIRVAVGELSPAVLVFLRTGLGALILLPIAFTRGGLGVIGRRWPWLLLFAAVEVAIPWFMLSSAEQHITSALAGLLISAVPLVSLVIALLFGNRQQMGPVNLAGLLLGLVGVALIVGFDLRASDWTALAEMAVVVVGYSLGPALLSRYLTSIPSVTVNGVALTLCFIAYAPVAALQWPHALPSPPVIGAVVVLAVVCTAIAFLLFFALIAEVGPVRATVITYVNPAIAAVLGVVVLRESLTLGMLVGFALVLAGSGLATRRVAPRPEGRMIPVPDEPDRVGEVSPVSAMVEEKHMAVEFDANVLKQIESEVRTIKAEYQGRVPEASIDLAADESIQRLAGSRVPQFVPLFVGRFTRQRIRELVAAGSEPAS